jgi:C_GCAxxG_C_C family probable redox protein
LKIGSALGGGICRTGETCGVVTGALMVLGLRNGQLKAIDKPAKELCYRIAARFISMFIARNHSIKCKELLGYDISTIQGRKMVRKRHLISTLCPRLVQDGAEIIEKMLEEKPNAAT